MSQDDDAEAPDARSEILEFVDHAAISSSDGRMRIVTAARSASFRGDMASALIPALVSTVDGIRTRADVVSSLEGRFARSTVEHALKLLTDAGFVRVAEPKLRVLIENGAPGWGELTRYLLEILAGAHVAVVGASSMVSVTVDALAALGIGKVRVVRADETLSVERWRDVLADLTFAVVCLEGPAVFFPWLDAFNAAAIQAGLSWTRIAALHGDEVQVGPTIRPGVTACYKCFEARFRSNLPHPESYSALEQHLWRPGAANAPGRFRPVAAILSGLASLEVVRALSADLTATTSGRLFTFDLSELRGRTEPVLKIPRCPACSTIRDAPPPRAWS
jgi:bacteriocin biosynthesis cyclodehydratase domain-containing protein